MHGAALVEHDANIYDDAYGFESEPPLPAVIDIGPLTMDTYEYPPQFLPLPALLRAITRDLLAARRFAAAAWTAAFSVLFAVLALLVVGTRPFVDFVNYHLPRLASGETFSFLSEPGATMSNLGAFGIPFKLRLIGWVGSEADAWALAPPVAWVYTLLIVAVAVAAGWRRPAPTNAQQQVTLLGGWFGLLAPGAMRSPFAPPEALIPVLWALSFRAAAATRRRDAVIASALWVVMMIVIPTPAPAAAAASLAIQTIIYATAIWLALARDR